MTKGNDETVRLSKFKCANLEEERHALDSIVEDPVSSVTRLRELMKHLEDDQGLRVVGKVSRFGGGGFIFIGVYGGRYQMNICDRVRSGKSGAWTVGRRDEWYQFERFDQAWSFLRPLIKSPLRAWVY